MFVSQLVTQPHPFDILPHNRVQSPARLFTYFHTTGGAGGTRSPRREGKLRGRGGGHLPQILSAGPSWIRATAGDSPLRSPEAYRKGPSPCREGDSPSHSGGAPKFCCKAPTPYPNSSFKLSQREKGRKSLAGPWPPPSHDHNSSVQSSDSPAGSHSAGHRALPYRGMS